MPRLIPTVAIALVSVAGAPPTAQGQDLTITVIYDNYTYQDGLGSDWGFAALIETGQEAILFDTGTRGDIFLRNFRALGKDPADIDALVFSHDHGDHTGGMDALFETGVRPPTYLLSEFSTELHRRVSAVTTAIDAAPGDEILAGVWTTGRVGDAIPEQGLAIPTANGLIVLTGCAHPGVVAMLERVRELSEDPVQLVMGGFHLSGAGADHVASTVDAVRAMGVRSVGATHCTGDAAIEAFSAEFGQDFVRLGAGRVLTFPAAR